MQVRCVECHESIEVADDTSFSAITCPTCASQFSLLGEQTIDFEIDTSRPGAVPSRSIGHFQLVRQLGCGSFGSVWLARDTQLDRDVAIKIPRKGQLNSQEIEQFLREARSAAQLHHPHIVAVHEVGREADTVYIVSDYIRGTNLDAWLSQSSGMTHREAAQLVAQIADALQHAHEAGVIHRDLKPGNIMMDSHGEPHIMDFGLAKRELGDVTMTVDGRILGTPAYMPPEQARGEGHLADRRSDLYSLGVIFYRLLTGELPFRGSPQMLILQILQEDPPGLRKLDARIARDLETICLKCMEKKPEARYATAAEVAEELRRWLAGEPIRARPVGTVERLWRWGKRNPSVAALTMTVLLLLLTVAGGSSFAAFLIAQQRNDAIQARQLAEEKEARAQQNERDAQMARAQAERHAEESRQASQQADQALGVAAEQRRLALNALDTLVNKVQNQLADTAGTFRLKRSLLETAFDGLKQVADAAGDVRVSALADASMAEAHQRLGEIFESLGRLHEAQREYQAAHQVLEKQLLDSPGDVQLKWNVSRAASRLGGAMLLLGDRDAARRYSQQCLDLRRDVASAYPNQQVRTNLATAYAKLGDVLRDMGLTQDAQENYRQALDVQQELALDASDEERAAMQGEVRATFDRLGELNLLWLNEPQTAQEHYDQSLQIAQAIRDASPKSFAARLNLATALVKRGNVSRRLNNPDADDYFRKALDLLEVLAQEEDPEILMVQGELALVLARLGQHERAAERAEKLRLLSPEYGRNLYNVACCYALCAAAVRDSAPVPSTADAESVRNEYVAKAIGALRQCLRHGLDRSTYLEIDPDLDAIRQAPEFQEILRELEALHPSSPLEQS